MVSIRYSSSHLNDPEYRISRSCRIDATADRLYKNLRESFAFDMPIIIDRRRSSWSTSFSAISVVRNRPDAPAARRSFDRTTSPERLSTMSKDFRPDRKWLFNGRSANLSTAHLKAFLTSRKGHSCLAENQSES